MANSLYDNARQSFLTGDIAWTSDNIKCCLVSSAYTVDLANHTVVDDLTGIIATSGNLTGKTATAGVADADDITFSTVASGSTVSGLVIYQDTGSTATSRLIAWIDTATGLPTATNDGDITITWSDGADKIFKL